MIKYSVYRSRFPFHKIHIDGHFVLYHDMSYGPVNRKKERWVKPVY